MVLWSDEQGQGYYTTLHAWPSSVLALAAAKPVPLWLREPCPLARFLALEKPYISPRVTQLGLPLLPPAAGVSKTVVSLSSLCLVPWGACQVLGAYRKDVAVLKDRAEHQKTWTLSWPSNQYRTDNRS